MEKFTFAHEKELSALGKCRNEISLKINDLLAQRYQELESFARKNFIIQSIQCGCTCHRCLEGTQVCGYSVHFVGKLDSETRELPVLGSSSSRGITWLFQDGHEELDADWFEFGVTEMDVIEFLIDTETEE